MCYYPSSLPRSLCPDFCGIAGQVVSLWTQGLHKEQPPEPPCLTLLTPCLPSRPEPLLFQTQRQKRSFCSEFNKQQEKERKKETTRASRILPPLWMRMVSIIPFSTHTESSSFYLLGIWSSQKAIHPCPNHLTF